MNEFDSDFLHATIRHLPIFLACALGLVLAAICWRRHSLSAGLTFAGSALFAIGLGSYLYWEFACIPELEARNAVPEGLDALILYGTPYLQAIGLALLLAAVFAGRRDARPERQFLDDE